MKHITVLGSTGSIGTQALDVIRQNPEKYCVSAMSCGSRIAIFREQLKEFHPEAAVTANEKDAQELKKEFPDIQWYYGIEGLKTIAAWPGSDIVLNSLVGMIGILPTYEGILAGKDIALANKETLVAAGEIITKTAAEKGVSILPVDSEHSAVFQCLQGNHTKDVRRLLLTASGGPLRDCMKSELEHVTVQQALKHPNWSMGNKISIDSATLMNKGLEVIEAVWLFGIPANHIEVLVHRQSIVHSMVEYCDGSVLAQLGLPDMRVPIAYALSYPERIPADLEHIDFTAIGSLTFESPDRETFRCLQYAYDAISVGGSMPAAMNAANEELVARFLRKEIGFMDIERGIFRAMELHETVYKPSLEEIIEIDRKTRYNISEMIDRGEIF